MALSLLVPLFPRVREEVVISFGTGALVTGVALIVTGFTQGERHEIAYYQQAIIVQMAGMGFGPAAVAWLRRGHGEPDVVFFSFTILYTIIMTCYLFYTIHQESSSGPYINCFLDAVPKLYGKKALEIVCSIIVGVSVLIIGASIIASRYINQRFYRGANQESERPPPITIWISSIIILIVFIIETFLAALIQLTLAEYSKFVSDSDRAALGAWQFGQIVPLVMLIQPIMEAIRALLPKVQIKRRGTSVSSRSVGKPQERTISMAVEEEEKRDSNVGTASQTHSDDNKAVAVTDVKEEVQEIV